MSVPATFQSIWGTWQLVAVVAAVLSICFAALAYMLSYIFRLKQLQVWAREEIYQALASAFIIAVAVIVVTAIVQFSCTLTNRCAGGDHVDAAINIMNNTKNETLEQLQYIFGLEMRVGMIQNMGKYYDFSLGATSLACEFGYCPTAFGFQWYMWGGASIISDSLNYAMSVLIPIISSFYAQLWMLEFVKAVMFPSLLALGIILRTFFFTRKVGGLLIAIALVMYTIYPLMYIMLGSYMTFTPHDFYYPSTDQTHGYALSSCAGGDFMPGGADPNHPFCIGVVGVIEYLIPGLPSAAGNYGDADYMFKNGCLTSDPNNQTICPSSSCVSSGLSSGTTTTCDPANPPDVYAGMRSNYNGVLPTVGYLLVPALFIPLLIILVVIASIRVLSPLFGGDAEIAGLTKIL